MNTGKVYAALMSGGRLLHACVLACEKARSPNDVVVRGMMRSPTIYTSSCSLTTHYFAHLDNAAYVITLLIFVLFYLVLSFILDLF